MDKDQSGLENSRPDLVSIEDEDADASHPSEHNLELGDPAGPFAKNLLQSRENAAKKRFKGAKEACGSLKTHNAWTALQVARNEQSKTRDGHKEAFAAHPGSAAYYPYWGVSAYPPLGYVYDCFETAECH